MRTVTIALFLAGPTLVWAANDEDVLRALAAQSNRVGIAAYLKQHLPKFHDAAAKAGLAEWLDGRLPFADFRARVRAKAHQPTLDVLERVTLGAPAGPSVAELYKSGAMDDPVKMAEALQKPLYSGEQHPIARALDAQWWGAVGIEPAGGKLVWFNPYLDIPELGIRRGEPMTAAQQDALLRMFAVKTTGDANAGSIGRGFFPSDVGRAVNPNPGVLTILHDGQVVPELVSKGAGPTRSSKGTGKLDLSEAYMDAEVSRNLMRAGSSVYVPVAVIDIGDGKAIYVRAAGSALRQQHAAKYTAAELDALLRPAGGARAWAEEANPRAIGRNAGILSGLGLKHGSLSSDNYGMRGELVDWGWAELGHRGSDAQKAEQLKLVEEGIRTVQPGLARAELAALDRAGLERLAAVNGVVPATGESDASLRERISFRMEGTSGALREMDRATLDRIVQANNVWTSPSDTDADVQRKVIERLKRMSPGETIGGIDRVELERIARANGVEPKAGDTDAQVSERLVEELRAWGSKPKLEGLAQQIDVDRARAAFEAEYAKAKAEASTFDIKLAERFMKEAETGTLRDLAKGYGAGYGASKDEALELLKRNGIVEAAADVKELPAAQDRARVRSVVRSEAAGAGQFVAAYLLKEAMNGRVAVDDLKEPRFWGDLAVFTGAAHLTSKLPLKGLGRAALPLAAGMAAVQLIHGQASVKDVLIDTGAYLAAGLAVNLLADGLIYPMLFAAGPPGWIAAGVYTVAKLAITLYAGEKLSGWLRGLLGEPGTRNPEPGREGVKQKVDGVQP